MARQIAALILSVLAGSAVVSGASAGTAADAAEPSITIKYSRAELATQKGTEALYARLKFAARLVCPNFDAPDLVRSVPAKACYEFALAKAVDQVQQPQLTALHARLTTQHISG